MTSIRVEANDGFKQTIATGGETEIDFDFPIYRDDSIRVLKTDGTTGVITELVLDTDFSVPVDSIGTVNGGVVELDPAIFPSGATLNDIFTCLLDPIVARTSNFSEAGDFKSDVLNQQLGIITQMIQATNRDVSRCLQLQNDDPTVDVFIEDLVENAVLAVNPTGTGIIMGPSVSEISGATASAATAVAAAAAAEDFADDAEEQSERINATSSTSNSISVAEKTFNTDIVSLFEIGQRVQAISMASPAVDVMYGRVTNKVGVALTIDFDFAPGSGTHTDWIIVPSGPRGAQGIQGVAGAGTGDMLKADNLSGLASNATARSNLGLGSAALLSSTVIALNADNLSNLASAATAFGNIKQNASESATGVVEMATTAEAATGTDTARAVTPAGVAAAIAANTSSPGLVFLQSYTASASSVIDITSVMSAAYDSYLVEVEGLVPSDIIGTLLILRTSADNGSSFAAGAANYSYGNAKVTQNGTDTGLGNASATSIPLTEAITSGTSVSGKFMIHAVNQTTDNKAVTGDILAFTAATGAQLGYNIFGTRRNTAAINALRLLFDTGNITRGKVRVYGLRAS